MAVIGKRRRE